MNSIEKQIKEMYEKAFFDVIDDTINSDKPDYDWIVNLYTEIKNRLIRYVKKDSKKYELLDSQFDIELFRQMIENDAFSMDSLLKLVNNTFYWIEKLQAPERDNETKKSKQIIFGASKDKIVSTFVREANRCVDFLDLDFENFVNNKK
jgi:hypothetical protein